MFINKCIVVIYGVPLMVDCRIEDLFCVFLCIPTFNEHCIMNKQEVTLSIVD